MFNAPFSFEGRIRRKEYALSFLIYFVYFLLIGNLIFVSNQGFTLVLCAFIPAWFFILAQSIKRTHDIGHSGWYIFIPFYNFLLFFWDGENEGNKYGPNPKTGKDGFVRIDDTEIDVSVNKKTEEPRVFVNYTYKSDLGELIIEQELSQPNIGERAFMDGKPAYSDKYKVGFMNYIHVEDGKVKELTMF